jgi:hypothetical protein
MSLANLVKPNLNRLLQPSQRLDQDGKVFCSQNALAYYANVLITVKKLLYLRAKISVLIFHKKWCQ